MTTQCCYAVNYKNNKLQNSSREQFVVFCDMDEGKLLKALRRRLGLSQKQFGDIVGESQQTIQHYEKNKREIRLGWILAAAEKLTEAGYKVDPKEFVEEINEAETKLIDNFRQMQDHEQALYLSMGNTFLRERDTSEKTSGKNDERKIK